MSSGNLTAQDRAKLLQNKNYKVAKVYFEKNNYKALKLPNIVKQAMKVLGTETPTKMRVFYAVQECGLLVSHMNNSIQFTKNTKVTTNMNNILFGNSGVGKDSALNKIRSCFKGSYETIKDEMLERSVEIAKEKCLEFNDDDTSWKDYWTKPKTLFPTISTSAGMLHQMDMLQKTKLGSYFFQDSEFLSSLKGNPDLVENLKATSIGYDLGNIPSKIVKSESMQTSDIEDLNINTLLFSSMHTLQADKNVKAKFVDLFTIQMARRSLFHLNTEEERVKEFDDAVSMVNAMRDNDTALDKDSELLTSLSEKVLLKISRNSTIQLETPKEIKSDEDFTVKDVFNMYLQYNRVRAKLIPLKFSMKAIATQHLQWKALKYAGLFTMLQGRMVMTKEDYFQAISLVELFNDDLQSFQVEANKEPYELLTSFCHTMVDERGKLGLTKHTLIKEGFISNTASDKKLEELASLCSSSDKNGVYTVRKGTIIYTQIKQAKVTQKEAVEVATVTKQNDKEITVVNTEPVEPVKPKVADAVHVSYRVYTRGGKAVGVKDFADAKEFKAYRNIHGSYGYRNVTKPFEIYEKLMSKDVSYSPYHFGDGVDSKGNKRIGYKTLDTIIDPSNTIILDIDKATISMDDMHILLAEHNHVIASTSDVNNKFKYRIAFQLDRDIDLTPPQWRKFYKSIASTLGIEVDPNINKASMFHGYSGARVLANYEGELLDTKGHIINAYKESDIKRVKKCTTQKQLDADWDKRFDDFEYHYDVVNNRTMTLYSAMRLACDKGWDKYMIEELINEINDGFIKGAKPYNVVKQSILSQIDKFL